MPYNVRPLLWTKERCIGEARKYSRIKDLQDANFSVYNAIRKNGWQADCYAHMTLGNKKHTIESVTLVAAKFPTRAEFQKQAIAEYTWAWKRNLIDIVSPHTKAKGPETVESVIEAAKLCKTNKEFYEKFPRQYSWMYQLGLMAEVRKFLSRKRSLPNVVYIWEAIGATFNGEKVYKIGISRTSFGSTRVEMVSKKSGFGCNLIAFVEVGEHARQIENAILKMGYNPKFYGFDGCTEFRALSDDQLEKALTIIREAAHDAPSLNQAA
jgi:hypothetical protein